MTPRRKIFERLRPLEHSKVVKKSLLIYESGNLSYKSTTILHFRSLNIDHLSLERANGLL